MKFFCSDTHFGHTNIIKYCNRPFSSVEEMDRELISRWNAAVKKDDTVYFVGDFAFASEERIQSLISSLNGYKIGILGNHDKSLAKMKELGFNETHSQLILEFDKGQKVLVHHYPYRPKDPIIANQEDRPDPA